MNIRFLLVFGFGLTLAGVWTAILTGQSLSFLKTLPAAPPPWGAAAVAGDASGIYVAEVVTFLRKYDRDGAQIWSRGLEGLHIRGMATHAAGVYAGGIAGGAESFVRLYDAQGTEIWTRQFAFSSAIFSYVQAVAADASGVYVAGPYSGGWYLRKYDTHGAELWTRRFELERITGAQSLVLAASPTGVYFGGSDQNIPFLRSYDASGTEIWTRPVDGDILTGITANASGVYVTGHGALGPFVGRYDFGGNQIWSYAGIEGWIQRIAVDADGIYVAGATSFTLTGQCSAGSGDAFLKRFDAEGSELWTRQFGTGRYEDVAGIVVDPGSIFVVGSQFVGNVQFPARPVDRAFLAKIEKAAVTASPSETRIRNECVVIAANYVVGAVSPGEIVTIFGDALGPARPVSATIMEGRPVDATLAETRCSMYLPGRFPRSSQMRWRVGRPLGFRWSIEVFFPMPSSCRC